MVSWFVRERRERRWRGKLVVVEWWGRRGFAPHRSRLDSTVLVNGALSRSCCAFFGAGVSPSDELAEEAFDALFLLLVLFLGFLSLLLLLRERPVPLAQLGMSRDRRV